MDNVFSNVDSLDLFYCQSVQPDPPSTMNKGSGGCAIKRIIASNLFMNHYKNAGIAPGRKKVVSALEVMVCSNFMKQNNLQYDGLIEQFGPKFFAVRTYVSSCGEINNIGKHKILRESGWDFSPIKKKDVVRFLHHIEKIKNNHRKVNLHKEVYRFCEERNYYYTTFRNRVNNLRMNNKNVKHS